MLTREIRPLLDEAMQQAAKAELLIAQRETARVRLAELQQEDLTMEQARLLLVEAGAQARTRVRDTLENVVTRALQTVFDSSYRFVVLLKEDGKTPEVRFEVVCGDPAVQDEPSDAMGGGVVDVVSMALRIAYQILYGIQGPILLDEPGKWLDLERAPKLAQIISELAEEFDLQIIMVTHIGSFAHTAQRVYRVTHNGNHADVTLLEV